MPTRLLDWTRNPLYRSVAVRGQIDVDAPQLTADIAVWAMRADPSLREHGRAEQHNSDFTRFLDQTVPNSENPSPALRGRGLHVQPVTAVRNIARTGQFSSLESFALAIQAESLNRRAIRKLTLPYSEVGGCFACSVAEGESRAHLMPTLDNVIHALGSRWRWGVVICPRPPQPTARAGKGMTAGGAAGAGGVMFRELKPHVSRTRMKRR